MALLPTFPIFQKTIRRIIQLVRSIASRSIRFAQKLRGGDKNLTAPVRIYWDDLNNHTLADLVRETETKASGRVHVISLVDFRRSIGDLWDKYKERIILIADSTIARKIGRGNTYIEQEEDTWILLLPKLAETDGQDLADSIAATIGEKLMGAKFSLHEAPFPSSAKLDVNKAINPDGSLDVDALKAEVTKVRSIQRSLSSDRTNRPSAGSLFPAAKQTPNPTRVRTIRSKLEQFLIPAWSSDTECFDSFFFEHSQSLALVYFKRKQYI